MDRYVVLKDINHKINRKAFLWDRMMNAVDDYQNDFSMVAGEIYAMHEAWYNETVFTPVGGKVSRNVRDVDLIEWYDKGLY